MVTWFFPEAPFGGAHVLVRIPAHKQGERLPVLMTYHGRGEALKGSSRGARGWLDDYGLQRAITRLTAPPLRRADFAESVGAARLRQINAQLAERQFRAPIIVMPYLADVLRRDVAFVNGPRLAEFVVGPLLTRVFAELPARRVVALDGVSLGGRAALLVGLSAPEHFVSVAAIQAAIDDQEIGRITSLAQAARKRNPRLRLRLLTSHKDYFLDVNRSLSSALSQVGVKHQFDLVRGTHSYEFNRGAGVYEMLVYHQALFAN